MIAEENGSFSVKIQGYPKDKLKVIFTSESFPLTSPYASIKITGKHMWAYPVKNQPVIR